MPPGSHGTAPDADPLPTPAPGSAEGSPSDDPLSPGPIRSAARCDVDSPPVRVALQLDTDDVDPPLTGWLEPLLERAIDELGLPPEHAADHRITVALLDDEAMADLHVRVTNVPGTTDVLTFDHKDDPGDFTSGGLEADLALGRDVAVREAQARGHDARLELLLYAVHGLLHLVGHDDHDADAYEKMHAAEDALLTQLGAGPLFSRSQIQNPKSEITSSEVTS
ncbi:MAG: rRNA maturation RNase YbeY [Planctomycetota bacterium]